jgi:transposase
VRRTAVVKLDVSDEQRDALHRTAEQYLHCANRAAAFCWNDDSFTGCKTNKRQARDAPYAGLREETDYGPNSSRPRSNVASKPSKGVSNAGRTASASLGRRSPPRRWTPTDAVAPSTGGRCRWQRSTAGLKLRSSSPSDSPTPYGRYVLSEDYEFRESTLRYGSSDDEVDLHISTRRYDGDQPEISEDTENQTILGIDLGVISLAVSSSGTFWQGDDYDHWCREFEKRRGEMQQRGTQAAHDAIQRLGKREEAWRKRYLHTIANEVVTEALDTDCGVIVFEEMTDIRDRLSQAKWHHIRARSDGCSGTSRTRHLSGCLGGTGRAEPHEPAVFAGGLWVHPRGQPPR